MTHPELQRNLEAMRVGITAFTVDDYFLIPKSHDELRPILEKEGLSLQQYHSLPGRDRKRLGWEEHHVSKDGTFTFPIDRQVLAHTAEDVEIEDDRVYRMREFFTDRKTGLALPLRTNLTAPTLKPLSTGPQTYEIRNVSGSPLTIQVTDLKCFVDIFPLDKPYVPTTENRGNFHRQVRGVIELGDLTA